MRRVTFLLPNTEQPYSDVTERRSLWPIYYIEWIVSHDKFEQQLVQIFRASREFARGIHNLLFGWILNSMHMQLSYCILQRIICWNSRSFVIQRLFIQAGYSGSWIPDRFTQVTLLVASIYRSSHAMMSAQFPIVPTIPRLKRTIGLLRPKLHRHHTMETGNWNQVRISVNLRCRSSKL